MLRIAVPNKGSLAETSAAMLTEAGYTGRRDPKDLHVIDPANEVEFFYLRPRDIATYVGSGALDVGITGRDLLLDARMPAREVESLGFADSTFRFAGPPGRFTELADLEGMRVATAYPGLVDSFLDERGIAVDLVPLDGAVESAVRLGVADAVADVVSTGTTLKQAGLEIFGPVLTVFKAKDLKEAIEISNSVEFGLSSSVYTKDITKAYEYINTVETGMVHVNASTLGGEVHLPFGGLNSSGVGQREQGTAMVDFFSEVITVYIDHAAETTERAKFI